MNFHGWALFCDSDIVFTENVKNLFDQADDKYAVMCAKHDYTPKEGTKMDGQTQTVYPRKNWSSVMLFNCAHPSNKKLTQDLVNDPATTGKYLHRFSWLQDDEVGEISHEWNWLVGWYEEPLTAHQEHCIIQKVDPGLKIIDTVNMEMWGKISKI